MVSLVNNVKHGSLFLTAWCISCTLLADQQADESTSRDEQREAYPGAPGLAGEHETSPPATSQQDTNSPPTKKPKRGIEKLDNKSRVKALAAITALVILGLGMVSLTWLGARVTRRYMNPAPFDHQRIKSSAPKPDDWAGKPLVDNSELERPRGRETTS